MSTTLTAPLTLIIFIHRLLFGTESQYSLFRFLPSMEICKNLIYYYRFRSYFPDNSAIRTNKYSFPDQISFTVRRLYHRNVRFTFPHNSYHLQFSQASKLQRCKSCHFFLDRKSTRLNSSHQIISYAVFCLKKEKVLVSKFVVVRCEGVIHEYLLE